MPKILVVDDEADLVRMLEFRLQQEGWEVLAAGDGRTAVDKAQAELPDLVILDVMMPLMDGMEVLRQLGYRRETRKIPVVMLTAKTGLFDMNLARELGVKDYVTKPFDPERLVAVVRKVLRLPPPAATPANR